MFATITRRVSVFFMFCLASNSIPSLAVAKERYTSAPRLEEILVNLMQLMLKIVGVLGVISLVIAGIIYLISAGNEDMAETGKRAIIYSIIGIVVSVAGLIVIQTVITLLE